MACGRVMAVALAVLFTLVDCIQAAPRVNQITPQHGSAYGGLLLTVYGSGFAPIPINNDDPTKGNKVYLFSPSLQQTYECDLHDQGCTTKQLTCYTRRMPYSTYFVRVTVDGVPIADANICWPHHPWPCRFWPSGHHTPTIESFTPTSGPPGMLVTIYGKIISAFYTNDMLTANSTNGNTERIQRVYVGGQTCELMNPETNNVYKILLDGAEQESTRGHMVCRMTGSFVGNQNATFLVSGYYGRSMPKSESLKVSGKDVIYMFQSFAEITGISPTEGSVVGGTRVTVSGRNFDKTSEAAHVFIGGQECDIEEIKDEQIICKTSAAPKDEPLYSGNRGMRHEMWTNITFREFVDSPNATDSSEAATSWVGEGFVDIRANDSYVGKLSGFFQAPRASEYQFSVHGPSQVYLYMSLTADPMNKTRVAHHKNRYAPRIFMDENDRVYLEVRYTGEVGRNKVKLQVHKFSTRLTVGQAGSVIDEEQHMRARSDMIPEAQNITLNLKYGGSTEEVQRVSVKAAFRLGMDGIWTGMMRSSDDTRTIQTALNQLPTIYPDTVTVSKATAGTSATLTVTFNSQRGSWSLLEAEDENRRKSKAQLKTTGKPSNRVFVLDYNGLPSQPIPTTDSGAKVKEAVSEMFSVRCSRALTAPPSAITFYSMDFETANKQQDGGHRVNDEVPFCGHWSLKNTYWIYRYNRVKRSIFASSNPVFCLGYRAESLERLTLNYTFVDSAGKSHTRRTGFNANFTRDNTWRYKCVNMLKLLQKQHSDASNFRIYDINFDRKWGVLGSNYVDAIFIGRTETTDDKHVLTYQRSEPKAHFRARDVKVEKGKGTSWLVSMWPHDCRYNLKLFTVRGAKSSTFTVKQTKKASPPVGGTFDLSWNNHTLKRVRADLSAEELKALLETIPDIGTLNVRQASTCADYFNIIRWRTRPGEQPLLKAIDSSVKMTGSNPKLAIARVRSGGVRYLPINGDMLSTPHHKPQVTALINGISTACDGNCDFQYSEAATPAFSDVKPTSGSSGTILTVTGQNFDAKTITNNVLVVGHVTCTVREATSTQMKCSLTEGVAGVYQLSLTVVGKGTAKLTNGPVSFTYQLKVSKFSPTKGSVAGGTKLTIQGSGFSAESEAAVGGEECDILSWTSVQIICETPDADSASSVAVAMTQAGQSVSASGKFAYAASTTPTVSKLSTSTGLVDGTGNLTITGTGFGTSNGSVKIGKTSAEIFSWADKSIKVRMPTKPAGSYPLKIHVPSVGFAKTKNIPKITYTFRVTSMAPTSGSLYGGARITLTGQGFSKNSSLNHVRLGDKICRAVTSSYSSVICEIQWTGKTLRVENKGSHPTSGEGYEFVPKVARVEEGDSVLWLWKLPMFASAGILINETENATAMEPRRGGFSSAAAKTLVGAYEKRFPKVGEYYYWTGPVDDQGTVIMRGTVSVARKPSFSGTLAFKIGQLEAEYKIGSKGRRKRAACSDVTDPLPKCSETVTLGDKAFTFSFQNCQSARVSKIWPNQGTSESTVSIDGVGFGKDNCQNEVKVGGYPCVIKTSSTTKITCKLDTKGDMKIGFRHLITVNVKGRGFALQDIVSETKRSFVLMPNIASLTPTKGSIKGGTKITITGSGFSGKAGANVVLMNNVHCVVSSMKYTEIICTTPGTGRAGKSTLQIYVKGHKATCTGSCTYTYDANTTPTVKSLTPASITAPANTLTIAGSRFGTDKNVVSVTVGGLPCKIKTVKDSAVTCDIDGIYLGQNKVAMHVHNKGNADSSAKVEGKANIASISPAEGSINGGTKLVIKGNGFRENETSVMVDNAACEITQQTLAQITCSTPPHAAGKVSVTTKVSSTTYTEQSFTYSTQKTPTLTSSSPVSGYIGDVITITGTGFSTTKTNNIVKLGEAVCEVATSSATKITCKAGAQPAGMVDVTVNVAGKGLATSTAKFEYSLSVTKINPTEGSMAGGQTLTLTGTGLHADAVVTICGEVCTTTASTATELTCHTPAKNGSTDNCEVKVTYGTKVVSKPGGYSYQGALTATITSVKPHRGGTGGGTEITIAGTKFGTSKAKVSITIAGTKCEVTTISDTEVKCRTGSHRPPTKSKVALKIQGKGLATQDKADFQYVDVWSSRFTWGGQAPPVEGDFVVVPSGQTLVIDVDTPILKMLLIKGGKVIFDEKDIELKSENIMITEGGLLQVGTETEPFRHKGIITLYGHIRMPELPIYGAKTIAVRNGTLDLHGMPRKSWTDLGETAKAKQRTLKLRQAVDWSAGDFLVLATTGGHKSQNQNEKVQIASVAADKKTLTLTQDLKHEHLGETQRFPGEVTLETRAEVGLLTHNVVVRGHNDPQWNDKIPACPAGFDPGQFATQTCFQGRFGEEIGSAQFGAAVMFHQLEKNSHEVVGRLEHVELTYMGQAFRIGRYPIHFHINGDMAGDVYVRGCSIHHTFNRAVNIHNSHHVLIEHNVVYDVMGGALFLEDGIEHGNVFQYNLVVFVRTSSSLLNDDITPAAFWITHPNNTLQHNHVAGGTHFGFWYRMHKHPDGPSFTKTICPRKIPIQVFQNNTVHSVGWYGLWIFEFYTPMKGGLCSSTEPEAAKLYTLTVWNSFRGAEWVEAGPIQLHNFVLANNFMSNFEMFFIRNTLPTQIYNHDGALLKDSVVIGRLNSANRPPCTKKGIVLPFSNGLLVDGIKFINFDEKNGHQCSGIGTVKIVCTCNTRCAAWKYHFQRIEWYNADAKALLEWEHQVELVDVDASLTGIGKGVRVVSESKLYPTDKCKPIKDFSVQYPASVCDSDVGFIRFGFSSPDPESLMFKNVIMTDPERGSSVLPWKKRRETHSKGWMALLVAGRDYTMAFENAGHISNFSYEGTYSGIDGGEFITMSVNTTKKRDHVQILPGVKANQSASALTYDANVNGDWFWDDPKTSIAYMISDKPTGTPTEVKVKVSSFNCFYKYCKPPKDASNSPPETKRPANPDKWSETSTWSSAEEGWGGSDGKLPKDGDKVKIQTGSWVLADTELPVMERLDLFGVLEFDNEPDSKGKYRDFVLKVTYLNIEGGRLIVGWEDKPFMGNAQIVLQGSHATPEFPREDGPELGSKVIGVFGGLDLHGENRSVVWTHLAKTADVTSDTITLVEPVDWRVGETILITSTSYSAWQTEKFDIKAVSSDKTTLTLNRKPTYPHLAETDKLDGKGVSYTIAAEVALLSRNVKVIGEDYAQMKKESFGARVIVATKTGENDVAMTGYARISNVEFHRSGQEGYVAHYDPRFSLAFLDTGTVSDIKPSYVRANAFHDGFSTAIGVFGANELDISNNVIHHTVGSGMIIKEARHTIRRNLVTLAIWPGSYNGRKEPGNAIGHYGIEIQEATDIVLQDNVVAGSERGGYRTDGEKCSAATPSDKRWKGNVAHSVMAGVAMESGEGDCHHEEKDQCSKLSGFTVYRGWLYGIYTNTECSIRLENAVLVDNGVGFFHMSIKPSSSSNEYAYKFSQVKDVLVVGQSPSLDCSKDVMTRSDPNVAGLLFMTSWFIQGNLGRTGIAWPQFASGPNGMPFKPWNGMKGYPAILGHMETNNVTFARFQKSCGSSVYDRCFSFNPANTDLCHPIKTQKTTLIDVADDAKIYVPRPQVSKVNPGACGDLDCDAKKRALLTDMDGTFLPKPGAVLPHSEFEWGGDRRRGLGDFRIPKSMLTEKSGKRIPVNSIAPTKGVYRDDCTYRSSWQAYECRSQRYLMLMLETMDEDRITRRPAPVAVLTEKHVDIINGPKDKGICGGYACNLRMQLYAAIVPENKFSRIHYTGTTPQHIRLFLIHAEQNQKVVISIFYSVQQRLDVFINGKYILPNNAKFGANGNLVYSAPTGLPKISDAPGTNLFDLDDTRELYLVLAGHVPYEIKMRRVVVVAVGIPTMSPEEFYGSNIVNNLARFLRVKPEQIRTVKAVSETSSGRRRKRATSTTLTVTIEIGDAPATQIDIKKNGELTFDDLKKVVNSFVEGIQTNIIEKTLNVTFSSYKVTDPVPTSNSTSWSNYTTAHGGDVVPPITVVVPECLKMMEPLQAIQEGAKFPTQPKLAVVDTQGSPVVDLRSANGAWTVTASLKIIGGDPRAKLMGTTTIEVVNGWANFTDLAISHYGDGYAIYFTVSGLSVPVPANMNVTSHTFGLMSRLLTSRVVSRDVTFTVGQPFTVNVEMADGISGERVENLAWRGHSWKCTVSIEKPSPSIHDATVSNLPVTVTFDKNNGYAQVSGLTVHIEGRTTLSLRIVSDPVGFDVTSYDSVTVFKADNKQPDVEMTRRVGLTFSADFNNTVMNKERAFAASLYNIIQMDHRAVIFNKFQITPGSIKAGFTVSGPRPDVEQVLTGLWRSVEAGLVVPFYGEDIRTAAVMTVDGQPFPPAEASGPNVAALVVVPILVILLVAAVIGGLVYRAKKNKQVGGRDKLYNRDSPDSAKHSAYLDESVYDVPWKQGQLQPEVWEATDFVPSPPANTSMLSPDAISKILHVQNQDQTRPGRLPPINSRDDERPASREQVVTSFGPPKTKPLNRTASISNSAVPSVDH